MLHIRHCEQCLTRKTRHIDLYTVARKTVAQGNLLYLVNLTHFDVSSRVFCVESLHHCLKRPNRAVIQHGKFRFFEFSAFFRGRHLLNDVFQCPFVDCDVCRLAIFVNTAVFDDSSLVSLVVYCLLERFLSLFRVGTTHDVLFFLNFDHKNPRWVVRIGIIPPSTILNPHFKDQTVRIKACNLQNSGFHVLFSARFATNSLQLLVLERNCREFRDLFVLISAFDLQIGVFTVWNSVFPVLLVLFYVSLQLFVDIFLNTLHVEVVIFTIVVLNVVSWGLIVRKFVRHLLNSVSCHVHSAILVQECGFLDHNLRILIPKSSIINSHSLDSALCVN